MRTNPLFFATGNVLVPVLTVQRMLPILIAVPKHWERGRVFLPPNPADGDTFEFFDEYDRTPKHPVFVDGNGYRILVRCTCWND